MRKLNPIYGSTISDCGLGRCDGHHERVDFKRGKIQSAKRKPRCCRHPEDVGLTIEDFDWILRVIVKWPREAGDPPLPDC